MKRVGKKFKKLVTRIKKTDDTERWRVWSSKRDGYRKVKVMYHLWQIKKEAEDKVLRMNKAQVQILKRHKHRIN